MAKKKDKIRDVMRDAKRESFRDWSIIQKSLLVIFLVGLVLAVADMSCGTKENTSTTSPSTNPASNPNKSKD